MAFLWCLHVCISMLGVQLLKINKWCINMTINFTNFASYHDWTFSMKEKCIFHLFSTKLFVSLVLYKRKIRWGLTAIRINISWYVLINLPSWTTRLMCKIWEKSHKTFVGKFIQYILNNLLVPEHVSVEKNQHFNLYQSFP